MSLFASSASVDRVSQEFSSAQDVRDLLSAQGWMPILRLENAEHWVRGGRRIILVWKGDKPGSTPALDLHHAVLLPVGEGWIVQPL